MQDKKKAKKIKVRDLKPKRDAKGGVVANVSISAQSAQSHQIEGPRPIRRNP